LKLSKIQGWLGYEPESMFKTLGSLNQNELDELKQRLMEKKQLGQSGSSQAEASEQVN
jgi:hypothetical protein